MTEKELLQLTKAGGTLKEQLDKMPAVQLQLADGTMLEETGKIDAVSGVIDQSTGSVSMRAVFPNDKRILRSGEQETWYSLHHGRYYYDSAVSYG